MKSLGVAGAVSTGPSLSSLLLSLSDDVVDDVSLSELASTDPSSRMLISGMGLLFLSQKVRPRGFCCASK